MTAQQPQDPNRTVMKQAGAEEALSTLAGTALELADRARTPVSSGASPSPNRPHGSARSPPGSPRTRPGSTNSAARPPPTYRKDLSGR